MFTADLASSAILWPVFGAGPRSCAGIRISISISIHLPYQSIQRLWRRSACVYEHMHEGIHVDIQYIYAGTMYALPLMQVLQRHTQTLPPELYQPARGHRCTHVYVV